MEVLQNFLETSQFPIFTAFILGLMTAISPCPLATNITAIGFISKDIESQRKVFINGLVYTLGRAISYTAIGLLFFFGASQFEFAGFFQTCGEKLLGPTISISPDDTVESAAKKYLYQRLPALTRWGFHLLLGSDSLV